MKQLTFKHAERIAREVLSLFADGQFDVATLFFSRFRSVISQIPTALQIIPAQIPRDRARASLARRRGL